MAWAFTISPQPNELLSGYLTRVAFAHGSAPHAFYRLHLGDGWFWTRDIDRGAALRHHLALSRLAELRQGDIRELTLRPWIEMLTPKSYSKRSVPAIVPWINITGVRQENRCQHALQYCPECLAADGIVDRRWRLSFYTRCSRHRRVLLDRCPACSGPFVPHRALGSILRCCSCQQTLQAGGGESQPSIDDLQAISLQDALVDALQAPHPDRLLASADLLALRSLASVLLTYPRATAATLELLGRTPLTIARWRRLEFARIEQRVDVMSCLFALLDQWPDAFRDLAGKLKLTRLAFSRCEPAPAWLGDEIARLPDGVRKTRRKTRRTFVDQVAELERIRPRNWRTSRAALLIRAAQRS